MTILGTHHKYLLGTRLENGSFKIISACEELSHALAEKQHAALLHENLEIHEVDEETGTWSPIKDD